MARPVIDRTRGLVSLGVVAVLVMSVLASPWSRKISDGPNIVLILSDDQSIDTIPHDPAVMPFLQSRVQDPNDHWLTFTNGFINDPLCCPARASIFTGQYAHNSGVLKNAYGDRLREDSTFATWLHGVGYFTGFYGKYENQYPFHRDPYVPPGWDQWAAKLHGGVETVYYDYTLYQAPGGLAHYGSQPSEYMPDLLANKAVEFIQTAPLGRPFFLEYAPTSPHAPWVPPPSQTNAIPPESPATVRPNVNEVNVSDKPRWVQSQTEMPPARLQQMQDDQRAEEAALISMDDAVAAIVGALEAKGILDDTVIIYLTDNGYSYGSHRWVAKRCEYEECNATPFFVRLPGATPHDVTAPVSNVDLAPTFAALAGAVPDIPVDGLSLLPLFSGGSLRTERPGVLLEWPGDPTVPPYFGIRTEDFLYVELRTGEVELYDLTGVSGEPDPYELHNAAYDKHYRSLRQQLALELLQIKGGPLDWPPISTAAEITAASPSPSPSASMAP